MQRNHNYHERLKEIINKQESGIGLSTKDIEDFNIITRHINTQDYASYCRAIRPTYKWAWFHEYIMSRANEALTKKNGRLLCKMAPQHGKSELFGRCMASYVFGKMPEWKILYITFSETRAKEVSADILGLIAGQEFQRVFPSVVLKDNIQEEVRTAQKRKNKLTISNFTNVNSKRGEFKAVGIEGSVSGFDANLIILDDFFSGPDEANSPTIRNKRWKIFTENILTRQQKETIILIMSTQWHADDIIGRLEEYIKNKDPNAPDWETIVFNAEKDERDYPYDNREIGEYLWSQERHNVYLEQKVIDPIGWMTKYQNIPPSMSGSVFDATCFNWYHTAPNIENMRIIISMDPNYKKDSKRGDDAAIVVMGILNNEAWLLEYSSTNKVDILDNVQRIKNITTKYPNYYSIVVEVKGQGEDIVTLLRAQGINKVESFDPKNMGKSFRAQEMIPYCRNGQFKLPAINLCPTIQYYVNQFMDFTGFEGGKDDLVDATSQVFIYYKYLLDPIQLNRSTYTIKNNFGVGKGLTKISHPLRTIANGKKAQIWSGK